MKNTKRIIAIFLCVLLAIAFATVAAIHFGSKKTANRNRVEDVTIIQLLATPEKYDGQRIRVVGVGNLEFEGNAIYLSKEDLSYRIYHAVWLDFDNNTSLSYEELLEDYFSVAYGEAWRDIYDYLERLGKAFDFEFIEQEKSLDYSVSKFYNPPHAEQIRTVPSITAEGVRIIKENYNSPYRVRTFSIRLLEMHAEYANLFAEALAYKALGADKSAWEKYFEFRDKIGKREAEFALVYDHGLAMESLKNNVFNLNTNRPEAAYM